MNTWECQCSWQREHVPHCVTTLQPTVPQLGLSSSGIRARLLDSVIRGKDKGPTLPAPAGAAASSKIILHSFKRSPFARKADSEAHTTSAPVSPQGEKKKGRK